MTQLAKRLAEIVGPINVLTAETDTAPYLTDWRNKYHGRARAVVRPASSEEVAAVVRAAMEANVAIVAQGGNTSMSGGATPDASGDAILLSLARMNRVRAVDPVNNTITVEAGVVLAKMQQVAAEHGRLFPLSLGAEGSCMIGGNLATNAGGTGVLRYGNARELCLGLEVVTAQGEIWDGLRALRKDNTGYDLRDLFVGSEGTLGIITAAVMKLFPQPVATLTALVATPTIDAAVMFYSLAQERLNASLTGCEVMSDRCLALVGKHFPSLSQPFTPPAPYAVLVEVSDSESEAHAVAALEGLIEAALAKDLATDAVVTQSIAQSRGLWALREHISESLQKEANHVKHDIALPISQIVPFVKEGEALVRTVAPQAVPMVFGHLGDGNLHYNVFASLTPARASTDAEHEIINRAVHDRVVALRGSISAEHGLGQLRRDANASYKSAVELRMQRALKQAFDPLGLLNPGKVLP